MKDNRFESLEHEIKSESFYLKGFIDNMCTTNNVMELALTRKSVQDRIDKLYSKIRKTKIEELKNNLISKEMNYIDLDSYMSVQGFCNKNKFAVISSEPLISPLIEFYNQDKIAAIEGIKDSKTVIYQSYDENDILIFVKFDIIRNNSEVSDFDLKITDIEIEEL